MKMKLILTSAIFLSMIMFIFAYDSETLKVMPFAASNSFCYKCHKKSDGSDLLKNPAMSCSTYCMTCHKDKAVDHHKVGMRMEKRSNVNLRFTGEGRMACYTCHDVDNRRFSRSSWKSESLYDSVFRKKIRYKTYFLTVKNDKGQLCIKCH
jgi:hypothetical protein